jgi:ABC-type glycerol-3-phosphate transport system substrate-binding protein
MPAKFTRRDTLRLAGVSAASSVLASTALRGTAAKPLPARQDVHEIVHWSWLTASDGEVWAKMIDAFNEAHADQGVQIRMEVVPDDQYGTKVLSSAAVGQAPDFGWGTAGLRAEWIANGVVLSLDDVMGAVDLDLPDFTEHALQSSRYQKYGDQLYMIPMDAMSLQVLLNLDYAQGAGLDAANPPQTGDELLEWAEKLTVRDGDTVTRSGFLMTGSGVQPSVTWGIVAHQMGFRRASDDLTSAALEPDAGKAAAQWVLDLFDERKVATRDITDRYKAFGTGQGAMFLTGPWTLHGYVGEGLNFSTFRMPKVGNDATTYFELGGLEMYAQQDESRYEATAQAIKWLSDNSFLWTTEGRGVAVRKSILDREDYRTAGLPWEVRGAFVEGMPEAVVGEIPVKAAPDFTIYTGSGFVAQTMDPVWAKERSIDEAIAMLTQQWQQDLDEG